MKIKFIKSFSWIHFAKVFGPFRTIFEIGLGDNIQTTNFLNTNLYEKAFLVEPQPLYYQQAKEKFCNNEKVTVINAAIVINKTTDKVSFLNLGCSSFIQGTNSPAFYLGASDSTKDSMWKGIGVDPIQYPNFEVDAKIFSELDDGKVDMLVGDCEGQEWGIIKHLISRPKIIKLEVCCLQTGYVNSNFSDIKTWMDSNGYKEMHKGNTDVIWVDGSLDLNLLNSKTT